MIRKMWRRCLASFRLNLRGRIISGIRCVVANVMDMTGWVPVHVDGPQPKGEP